MSWSLKGLPSLVDVWPCLGLTFQVIPGPRATFLLRTIRTWLLPALAAYFLTTTWCHFGTESLTFLLCTALPRQAWIFALPHSEVPATFSSLDLGLSCPSHWLRLPTAASSSFLLRPDFQLGASWVLFSLLGGIASLSILVLLLRKDTSLEY